MANDGLTISVREMLQLFPDSDAARKYIESRIWPNGPVCPKCSGTDRIFERKNGFRRCGVCKIDFSVLKGTVFERSHIKLDLWIHAMYLLLTARKGISSLQLSKELSITQTAAWFLLMRLREACGNEMQALKGVVEVDECYIGGLEENKHASKKLHRGGGGYNTKTIVIGMRERGGRTKALHLKEVNRHSMQSVIADAVVPGSEIHTDEHPGYQKMPATYTHKFIRHKDGEYHTKEGVGTNGIESVWAVLKRGLHGVYHSASPKHINRYLDEFTFRLNDGNVKQHTLIRLNALVDQCAGKRLTYATLTA